MIGGLWGCYASNLTVTSKANRSVCGSPSQIGICLAGGHFFVAEVTERKDNWAVNSLATLPVAQGFCWLSWSDSLTAFLNCWTAVI